MSAAQLLVSGYDVEKSKTKTIFECRCRSILEVSWPKIPLKIKSDISHISNIKKELNDNYNLLIQILDNRHSYNHIIINRITLIYDSTLLYVTMGVYNLKID